MSIQVGGNARPSLQAEANRQCYGPCGQSKPQGEFSFNEWRKGTICRRLCLVCSRHCTVTPPGTAVVEAIKLDATSNENSPPNFSSPCRAGASPQKRKSAFPCGLRERTSPSSPSSLPLQLAHSTAPSKKCRGRYDGFFGSAILFATKAYQHTAQKLVEMSRDPNAGVRRFTESALARTWHMCLPFHGVLVSRADNPSIGFVFRSLSCSGGCSSGTRCSHCASQTLRKEI